MSSSRRHKDQRYHRQHYRQQKHESIQCRSSSPPSPLSPSPWRSSEYVNTDAPEGPVIEFARSPKEDELNSILAESMASRDPASPTDRNTTLNRGDDRDENRDEPMTTSNDRIGSSKNTTKTVFALIADDDDDGDDDVPDNHTDPASTSVSSALTPSLHESIEKLRTGQKKVTFRGNKSIDSSLISSTVTDPYMGEEEFVYIANVLMRYIKSTSDDASSVDNGCTNVYHELMDVFFGDSSMQEKSRPKDLTDQVLHSFRLSLKHRMKYIPVYPSIDEDDVTVLTRAVADMISANGYPHYTEPPSYSDSEHRQEYHHPPPSDRAGPQTKRHTYNEAQDNHGSTTIDQTEHDTSDTQTGGDRTASVPSDPKPIIPDATVVATKEDEQTKTTRKNPASVVNNKKTESGIETAETGGPSIVWDNAEPSGLPAVNNTPVSAMPTQLDRMLEAEKEAAKNSMNVAIPLPELRPGGVEREPVRFEHENGMYNPSVPEWNRPPVVDFHGYTQTGNIQESDGPMYGTTNGYHHGNAHGHDYHMYGEEQQQHSHHEHAYGYVEAQADENGSSGPVFEVVDVSEEPVITAELPDSDVVRPEMEVVAEVADTEPVRPTGHWQRGNGADRTLRHSPTVHSTTSHRHTTSTVGSSSRSKVSSALPSPLNGRPMRHRGPQNPAGASTISLDETTAKSTIQYSKARQDVIAEFKRVSTMKSMTSNAEVMFNCEKRLTVLRNELDRLNRLLEDEDNYEERSRLTRGPSRLTKQAIRRSTEPRPPIVQPSIDRMGRQQFVATDGQFMTIVRSGMIPMGGQFSWFIRATFTIRVFVAPCLTTFVVSSFLLPIPSLLFSSMASR